MPTYSQLCKNKRIPKTNLNKTPTLKGCPQKKGMCLKLILRAPKKPNSALRKLAKVKFNNEKKVVYAFIPGEKHNLHPYSTVLMRGGRVQDLPGVKYHLIRGKLDLLGIKDRVTARSKYGTRVLKRYL